MPTVLSEISKTTTVWVEVFFPLRSFESLQFQWKTVEGETRSFVFFAHFCTSKAASSDVSLLKVFHCFPGWKVLYLVWPCFWCLVASPSPILENLGDGSSVCQQCCWDWHYLHLMRQLFGCQFTRNEDKIVICQWIESVLVTKSLKKVYIYIYLHECMY